MKSLSTYLFEARVGQLDVKKQDDSKAAQDLRGPGDVGKVDRLRLMHQAKNGAKKTTVPNTADRLRRAVEHPGLQQAADSILKDLGYKGKGNTTKEVDVDFKDPFQYNREVRRQAKKMGTYHKSDRDDKLEADPEGTVLPRGRSKKEIEAGMEKAQKSGQLAGRDAITTTDKELDKAIQQAYAPTVGNEVEIGDEKVGTSVDMRHGFQGSGVGLDKKTELDDDYLNQAMGAIIDPDLATKKAGRGGEIDKTDSAIDKRQDFDQLGANIPFYQRGGEGGYELEMRNLTRRDAEMHSDEGAAEADANNRRTPEQKEYEDNFRKAMKDGDYKKAQDMAFKFKDVSDERVQEVIDMFGAARGQLGRAGKDNLIKKIEGRGGTDGDRSVIWGGEIDADLPPEARQDDDGNDLPPGMYNTKHINDEDTLRQVKSQRAFEMVRTYLKQGLIDGYAPHEGFRSMLDMDLEHLQPLKDGGMDGPDNWLWASAPINQGRGEGAVDKYADQAMARGNTGPSGGEKLGQTTQGRMFKPTEAKRTFDGMFGDNALLGAEFRREFGDLEKGEGRTHRGVFDAKKLDELDDDQREEKRQILKDKYGFSDEQIMGLIPDQGMLKGTSFQEDPAKYDEEGMKDQRFQLQYRKALEAAKEEMRKNNLPDEIDTPAKLKQYVQDQMKKAAALKQRKRQAEAPPEDDFGLGELGL